MATFDRLADLPLTIEGYELEGREYTIPGFDRLSTVIRIKDVQTILTAPNRIPAR